jgi:hypothetical protein
MYTTASCSPARQLRPLLNDNCERERTRNQPSIRVASHPSRPDKLEKRTVVCSLPLGESDILAPEF